MQLHDGVLGHAAGRRLDHTGYRYEKGPMCDLNGEQIDQGTQPCEPCILPAAGAVLQIAERSDDGEPLSRKVEQFVKGGRAALSVEERPTGHPVHFCARSELQKWLCLGYVDFAELFRGFGELTIRVSEAG